MAELPFGPTRVNHDDEEVNYVPNEIDDTVKGGSALPGSAVGSHGQVAPGAALAAAEAQGFVGTRHVPGE